MLQLAMSQKAPAALLLDIASSSGRHGCQDHVKAPRLQASWFAQRTDGLFAQLSDHRVRGLEASSNQALQVV